MNGFDGYKNKIYTNLCFLYIGGREPNMFVKLDHFLGNSHKLMFWVNSTGLMLSYTSQKFYYKKKNVLEELGELKGAFKHLICYL